MFLFIYLFLFWANYCCSFIRFQKKKKKKINLVGCSASHYNINLLMPSGLCYLNSPDLSISNKKGVWLIFIYSYHVLEIPVYNANRVDPGQTPRFAASDLDQQSLQMLGINGLTLFNTGLSGFVKQNSSPVLLDFHKTSQKWPALWVAMFDLFLSN